MLTMTADERRYFLGPDADFKYNDDLEWEEEAAAPLLQVVTPEEPAHGERQELSLFKKCVNC